MIGMLNRALGRARARQSTGWTDGQAQAQSGGTYSPPAAAAVGSP